MRSVFVAILVSLSFLLAGCADKKDGDDHTYTCPDGTELDLEQFPDHENSTFNPLSKCPKKGGSTNSTSQAPNLLPTLTLTVTDDGGNETPVTLLMGNLTFSAEGSSDPDGSITGIAVSVTDSNTTRTATLYDPTTKTFQSATFKFDRPGIVNVTVAMVDDRAGFTVNQTKVYVNHPQVLSSQTVNGFNPIYVQCAGEQVHAIVDATFVKPYSFQLLAGATWVEAVGTGSAGDPTIAICAPDNTELSEPGTPSTATTPGTPLPAPVGIESYYVGATTGPDAPSNSISVTVMVHYEPDTRDAAAAE